jgi:glycerate dehydrogenase
MMERIVYLDRSLLPTAVRRPTFEHEWIEYATSRPEEVKASLEGATVAITHRVFLSGEDLPPLLRLIALGLTGAERIDLAACRARRVHVCNVRSWSDSVSEHVFALALRRSLLAYHSAVRSGAWSSSPDFSLATEPFGRTLRGAALGIIGFGTLGRSVAQVGRGLGMDVLVAERKGAATLRVGRAPFHEVMERSDLLAVLCPLTPETHRLIGAEELASMKRDALLINCARGGIIDEFALPEAVAEGRIGGAGIAVENALTSYFL